jgi:glycosyltransferase involved in cell wall biosynthesis/O-antigen ligase
MKEERMNELKEHTSSSATTSPGSSVLEILFVIVLLLIGWGRIEVEMAPHMVISLGGTSRALVFIVFFLYILVRLKKADIRGIPSLSDPVTLFTVLCGLSNITGQTGDFSLFAMNLLPALLAYYIIRYVLSGASFEAHLGYFKILVFFVVLLILRGFADAKGNYFVDPTILSTSSEHHTLVALIILAGLPLALALIFIKGSRNVWLLLSMVIITVGMLLANSRIGWLALIVMVFYLLLSMKERRGRVVITVVTVVTGVLFVFFFPHLHRRFMTLFNLMADSDFVARLEIWHYSFIMLAQHLLLGIGFSEKHFLVVGEGLKPGFLYHHPHNLLLGVGVYTGLAGLFLFGWLSFRIIKALGSLGKSASPQVRIAALALKASFLSILLVNMADTMVNSPRPTLISFLLMGLLFSLSEGEEKKKAPSFPVRVIYFIGTLGRGGAEGQLLGLIRRLDRTKFEPHLVVLREEGELCECCKKWGIEPFYLGFKGFLSTFYPWNALPLLGNAFRLFLRMTAEKPLIVHGYLFSSYVTAVFFGVLTGVPLIITGRRSLGSSKTRTWNSLHRLIEIIVNSMTDRVVANSRAVVADTITREALPSKKVTYIHNGVDLGRYERREASSSLKASLKIPGDARVIGMVANLIHYKNHMMLLRAIPFIREKIPGLHVLLVGRDSGIQEKLESYASEYEWASSLTFVGPRDDVPDLLSLMEVSVLTSREEGFPNALLESMASGLPVVATRVGGVPEVVAEGETAFLVDSEDHEALALRVIELLSDPALARSMGEKGRERVGSLFSLEAMVAATEALYDELLGEKGFTFSPLAGGSS